MSESTDEALSHACEHCGKRFYRRRYVNQHTRLDSILDSKIVRTKYCSVACRQDAYRVRHGQSASVTTAQAADDQSASVTASTPAPAAAAVRFKNDQADLDAFERMRAGRQLSRWEPTACAPADDPGWEIPEFLQRR
jgi:hypothetical protein